MLDKVTETLIDILKLALAQPGEQRLYRTGKLEGLLANRTGINGEAAERAIGEGLLEVVRSENKGKMTTEWVRITPRGVEFLHHHESPVRSLEDLRAILQTNRDQIPLWLADMRAQLQTLSAQLAEEAQRWTHRLDALGNQVEEVLNRVAARQVDVPGSAAEDAPWAGQALTYLQHRRSTGTGTLCALPELFAAVHEHHPELTLTAFHDRLRRLHDRRLLQLLPFAGSPEEIPEPEFALPEGPGLLYYAQMP